uniref:Uncharacterized protein n=1 Tax=Trichinella nativa TaxID=6335 RepID=A0A0V1KI71_9BILA
MNGFMVLEQSKELPTFFTLEGFLASVNTLMFR